MKSKYDLDNLFLRLLSYNILTLSNQSELKSKMHKNVISYKNGYTLESKILISDGENFTMEVKVNDKFRNFYFDNPESYSEFYTNVSELQDYSNIVKLFNELLHR